MSFRIPLRTALLALPLALACGEEISGPALNDGPVRKAFEDASVAEGVPTDLLLAVGWYETRWAHITPEEDEPGHAEGEGGHGHHRGRWGIMQLSESEGNDTLGLASDLTEQGRDTLKRDLGWNVRGAAAVLRRYADEMYEGVDVDGLDLFAWRDVIARWSGLEDPNDAFAVAEEVFVILRDGAGRTLESGENLELFPNPGLGQAEEDGELGRHEGGLTGFAGAKWNPAHSSNYGNGRGGVRPKYITIHTMQGSYAGSISWFRNPTSNVSAHYCVRSRDGEITQMVDENNTAWHVRNWNSQAVGIEHEGFVADAGWYTDAMYRASARLTCDIARRWGIPVDREHIKGHVEFSGNNHTDPGRHWDWSYYMSLVRQCGGGSGGGGNQPADNPNSGGGGNVARPGQGTIQGVVYTDGNTNSRVAGASIRLSNGMTATADSSGYWSLRVPAGTYTVSASRTGFNAASVSRTVAANTSVWASTNLTRAASQPTGAPGRISGVVYEGSDSSKRIAGAQVSVGGRSVTTDANGRYSIEAAAGTRDLDLSAAGFLGKTLSTQVRSGQTSTVNAGLVRRAATGTGSVVGVVYEAPNTDRRIAGARVTLSDGARTLSTTAMGNGYFEFKNVAAGNWRVTASATGYGTGSKAVTALTGQERWGSVGLVRAGKGPAAGTAGKGELVGVVYESPNTNRRLPGASVTLSNGLKVTADGSGVYRVAASGTVTAVASYPGFAPRAVTRTIPAAGTVWGSVGLVKGPAGSSTTGKQCTPTKPRTIHLPPKDIELKSPLMNQVTTTRPTFEFTGVGDATAKYRLVIIQGDKEGNEPWEFPVPAGEHHKVVSPRELQRTIHIWSAYAIWDDCVSTEPTSWGFFVAQ